MDRETAGFWENKKPCGEQGLKGFDNFTGSQALCAYISVFCTGAGLNAHLFDIRHPASFRRVVGVTHVVANERAFATNITFLCHL